MATNNAFSRRNLLRGLGVSVALPMFDSLRTSHALAGAVHPTSGPLRAAFLFVPNGAHIPDFFPKTDGFGFELPYILQPLANVRDDLLILSGLTHDKGRANGDGPGDHARSASCFLTGAQPRKTSAENIRSGMSVDQIAAKYIGNLTRFGSLQLGCERGRSAGNCDSGYSCAYSSSISWAGEASPLGKEVDPRLVFERLFSNGKTSEVSASQARRESLQKSILDFISDDASRLHKKLALTDQRKLDEYLTGVREIERRIERSATDAKQSYSVDYRRPSGVPKDYAEHIRLLCDMMVLAFQTDSTRLCTFMLADEGSNRSYRDIGVPEGHHDLSHHGGDSKKQAKIREINRFHVTQLAYLLERLKSIPEGEGTLLDNCMVLYGGGISDGNRHNRENLPILMAGRGGGTIDTGRHVHYEQETPMCNLLFSMLNRLEVPVESVGDSTGPLPGLTL